jgi:delta14-sterol reductase
MICHLSLRELNPRIGTLDLKEFCELRPGLIGWAVINLGMAFKQYQKRKLATGVGSISISMFLITLLQGFYVWDALYMEKAILTTMDITTDGFGFMLCFGDLSWVPFIYSLQARYLVDYDPEMSLVEIVVIFSIYLLGFYVFRSANSQKDAFRTNPLSDEVSPQSFFLSLTPLYHTHSSIG